MRTIAAVSLFLLFSTVCFATEGAEPWSLREIGDGLHGLVIDSTGTKSVIVEFDESLCLIEVSLSAKGGGASELTEHRPGGEAILRFLKEEFPGKPLETVLHSHWHPHSLASIAPFLEEGISLVTTRSNFERIREFADSSLVEAHPGLIRYVEGDSLIIGQGPRRIVVHRLQKEDYPSLPGTDYLFFHLPAQRALHCGCMYNKWRGDPVNGREILTTREQDLYKFITAKGLDLDGLIRLNREDDKIGGVLPVAGLQDVIRNGITTPELTEPFQLTSTESLHTARDRLVRDAIANNMPGRLFNGLVYEAIEEHDLPRAKELALLQALVVPSNANAWDTLGEVHYFLGELAVARAYEKHSRRIDPDFNAGGESAWKTDLARFQKQWSEEAK